MLRARSRGRNEGKTFVEKKENKVQGCNPGAASEQDTTTHQRDALVLLVTITRADCQHCRSTRGFSHSVQLPNDRGRRLNQVKWGRLDCPRRGRKVVQSALADSKYITTNSAPIHRGICSYWHVSQWMTETLKPFHPLTRFFFFSLLTFVWAHSSVTLLGSYPVEPVAGLEPHLAAKKLCTF